MRYSCRKCEFVGVKRRKTVRYGQYYRTSDARWVQRYQCLVCKSHFSSATFHPCYRQKKRHKNQELRKLLCSGVSQRRAARHLHIHRTTVVRKFLFLGLYAEFHLRKANLERPRAIEIQIDDMETFEHSKYKPLSITLAVESGTRRILGVEVSTMATKVPKRLALKYLPREDSRREARERLFQRIEPLVVDRPIIKSDSNPYYPSDIKRFYPESKHVQYIGRKPASIGLGELKRGAFDPLFSLNHTCAMFRANVNRLFRKTWCTTKQAERLYTHLVLYAEYHNAHLKPQN